jgi:hypothetical protein
LAGQRCKTPEAYKAWSQNLGHASPLTTFTSYGNVAQHRQDEILAEMANPGQTDPASGTVVMIDSARLDRLEAMMIQAASGK